MRSMAITVAVLLLTVSPLPAQNQKAKAQTLVQEAVAYAKTKGSGWVDYKYPNPKTSKIDQKSSFVELFEDVVIGCGTYK